jgi:hypothetical protein
MSYVRGLNLKHGCSVSGIRILVIANKSNEEKAVRINMPETALAGCTQFQTLLGSDQSIRLSPEALDVRVDPRGMTIIRLR